MRKLLLASSTLLALAVCVAAPVAQAAYTVTLTQEGGNVVAEGSGTFDTAGLSSVSSGSLPAELDPDFGEIYTGPATATPVHTYGSVTGPRNFGSGGFNFASSGSGDLVGISGIFSTLTVPAGYVSGSALTDSSTYDNQSFSSLGVTPGTYTWTWGSGATADSFTLDIPAPSVPEPASLALFGTGVAGLGLIRRRRRG